MLAAERFGRLLAELTPTDAERAAGTRAFRAVRATLQTHYYGHLALHDHARVIGACAKATSVRPPRPIDMLFVLPKSLRQTVPLATPDAVQPRGILDAVRQVLETAHGAARMSASGRAILVTIGSDAVEVQVAFADAGGRYLVCVARGDGRFEIADPALEESTLAESDVRSHGNTRDLIRMMKCWQAVRGVPLPSFALERLVIEFLSSWPGAGDPVHFYDWIVRDFFAFLVRQAGRALVVPGTDHSLALGAEWLFTAGVAQTSAARACDFETRGLNADAWWEWEKIFGERVPLDEQRGT